MLPHVPNRILQNEEYLLLPSRPYSLTTDYQYKISVFEKNPIKKFDYFIDQYVCMYYNIVKKIYFKI